jgi:hypothetical protein
MLRISKKIFGRVHFIVGVILGLAAVLGVVFGINKGNPDTIALSLIMAVATGIWFTLPLID